MGSFVSLDLAFGLAMAPMGFAGNDFCSDFSVCRHWGFSLDAQVVTIRTVSIFNKRTGSRILKIGRFDRMKMIRLKIGVFWFLGLLFFLLLYFWWSYRVLWLALPLIMGLIRYAKPRLPIGSRRIALLIRLGFILCVVSCIIHAFYQSSAAALIVAKIACTLFTVPVVCYTAYLDYATFASPGESA